MIPAGTAATNLLVFGALFLVLYFGFVRRRARPLKVGDDVATDAGLVGKLVADDGTSVTIELATQVRFKCARESVRHLDDVR